MTLKDPNQDERCDVPINLGDPMLNYMGYKLDDTGIMKPLRKRYAVLWDQVVTVATIVIDGNFGRYYKTVLESLNGKDVALKCQKGMSSFSNLSEYSEVLNYILRKLPEDIIFEKTRFVAKWGAQTNTIQDRKRAMKCEPHDVNAIKLLANLYWVRFDFRKARKLFQSGLEINPIDTEILESLALIDRDLYKNPQTIISQYEHILSLVPNNGQCLRTAAIFCLNVDDDRGERYAQQLLVIKPDEILARIALGYHYFRKGFFAEAKAVFREVGEWTTRNALKDFSKTQIAYIETFEMDPSFRKKEKIKSYVRLISILLSGVIFLFAFGYKIFEIIRKIFRF